jgi:hypothetical protein
MLRRWGFAALIAAGAIVTSATVAMACGYQARCGPGITIHVGDRHGSVGSRAFIAPGNLVSVPAIVVPIPVPGPIGPVGDGAVVADASVSSDGGTARVSGGVRTPAGDVSIPNIVVPIPQPGPIGPIGEPGAAERVVATVKSMVADLLPSREVGGISVPLPPLPGGGAHAGG